MPYSLRSKIKHLAYKGEFNERERDRLLRALDHEIDVTYICDRKKCPECSKLCNHTTDISHAVNFEPVSFNDEKTVTNYEEKMPKTGHWEDCSNGWMCSNCYKDVSHESDFCPHCGADMKGDMDDKRNSNT